ncbi:glycosyltransferase [Synechococcus sp. CBW1004]|uniref:glycosyltransferase n=1 Tax=Synechococcus sp. CBW1004 TaxID=1353136 RepID=UPI0018CEF532|nr:glycosyltransferase [Synechococcus sp. CBW1004]QPN63164.1 hypothetical protein H8F25_16440 [Synechococcus sp. CBW1004]
MDIQPQGRSDTQLTRGDDLFVNVHMFWAYGDFSTLERLAATSFIRHGYHLTIWTYGDIKNIPVGASQCDAREIVPENHVFVCGRGSYAAFSDLFRYTLLSQRGGLWSDTDVICLIPMSQFMENHSLPFVVQEMVSETALQVNNNLIYHPSPSAGDLVDLACAISQRFKPEKLKWGDCGPKLLTALVNTYPHLSPLTMPPSFANPVAWNNCPHQLLDETAVLPQETRFLHCFNEMWRRSGVDKDMRYPSNSILGRLCSELQDFF